MLLLCRAFVARVVTVDHETREGESTRDAEFVVSLAEKLGLPCTVLRRSEIERNMRRVLPPSQDWFRRVRMHGFRMLVIEQQLAGVLLGHQLEDVAETVALRLIRGSSFLGLRGIATDVGIGPLRICRPLLGATREQLREYLRAENQPWREDATNATLDYGRNRVRQAMTPQLQTLLVELAKASDAYYAGLNREGSESLREPVMTGAFEDNPLGRWRARIYLARLVPPSEMSMDLVERFVAWSSDAAGRAFNLPRGRVLRRRKGEIT